LPPCSVKKGAVNTPSIIQFFEKENGGFDFISKPPHGLFWAAKYHLPQLRFFLLPQGSTPLLFTKILNEKSYL